MLAILVHSMIDIFSRVPIPVLKVYAYQNTVIVGRGMLTVVKVVKVAPVTGVAIELCLQIMISILEKEPTMIVRKELH